MTESSQPRRLSKERIGEVVSDKMAKTIVVQVERRVAHRRFKKIVTRYSKHYAHDEKEQAGPGDRVLIRETRPLSRLKRWTLVEVVQKAHGADAASVASAGVATTTV